MSKYGVISGPYFFVFGLNTEIYSLNVSIQSEYRKIRTRNNSVFGHFLRSGYFRNLKFSPYSSLLVKVFLTRVIKVRRVLGAGIKNRETH